MTGHLTTTSGFNESVIELKAARQKRIRGGATSGLIEGTEVATETGWRAIDGVMPGDLILTVENGLQKVRDVARKVLWSGFEDCPEDLWPIYVPAGCIGNRRELVLAPQQGVMVENSGPVTPGLDQYTLIPALALDVLDEVERVEPYGTIELIQPVFERDHMVFADHGALLHCSPFWDTARARLCDQPAPNYPMLSLEEAQELVTLKAQPQQAQTPRQQVVAKPG